MRVGFPGAPRLAWYDRNPIIIIQAWSVGAQAPHASTIRWTYTVPAGKKAYVELIYLAVVRRAAPTTPALARLHIDLTPSGGSTTELIDACIFTGNVGDTDKSVLDSTMLLYAGDRIRAWSVDQSTGGTVDYIATAKATEFNA